MSARTYKQVINLCIAAMAIAVLISNRFGDAALLPKVLLVGAAVVALTTHIVAKKKKLKDEDCEDGKATPLENKGTVALTHPDKDHVAVAEAVASRFFLTSVNEYHVRTLAEKRRAQMGVLIARHHARLSNLQTMQMHGQEEPIPAWRAAVEISKALAANAAGETRYEVKLTSDMKSISITPIVETGSVENLGEQRMQKTQEQFSFYKESSSLVH